MKKKNLLKEFLEQRKRDGRSMSSMQNSLHQNSGPGVNSEVTTGTDLPPGRFGLLWSTLSMQ